MLASLSPSWLLPKTTTHRSFESNSPDISRLCLRFFRDILVLDPEGHLTAKDSYNLEYLLKLEELHQLLSDSTDCEKLRKVADILINSGRPDVCKVSQTLNVDLCALQRNTIQQLFDAIKE